MPTSTIEIEDNIIDFHQRRRELIIKNIIQTGGFPRDQIENIIKMHEFLTRIDYAARNEEVTSDVLDNIQEEIVLVREKFEELFEIIKGELFIDDQWRTR